MSESKDNVKGDVLLELYRTSRSARDFEIGQLTQRNNFFMVFQGVLLAGLAQASGSGRVIPVVAFMICATGVLVSVLQAGMAAGAKFWTERWEYALEEAEQRLLSTDLRFSSPRMFSADAQQINEVVRRRLRGKWFGKLVGARLSPSRIPIAVALLFTIVWALLLLCTIRGPFGVPAFITGFPEP